MKNDYLRDLVLLRKDPQLAGRVLQQACAGNVTAQYTMGPILDEGRGVTVDLVKAWAWLTVAVLQGNRAAVTLRNIVGSQLTDAEFEAGKRCAADYEKLPRTASDSH